MKLLIGVVTNGRHHHCLDEFLKGLDAQNLKVDTLFVVNKNESAYATLLRSKNVMVQENPSAAASVAEVLASARNLIRTYALKNEYDYLLFVDGDVILPRNALLVLQSVKADVVSGIYLQSFVLGGKTVIAPVLFKDVGEGNCQLYTYEGVAASGKTIEVGAAGLGCCLMSNRVLDAVPFRTMGGVGEEMAFFVDARKKGFKTFAQLSVKCVRRVLPVSDPNAHLFEWRRRVGQVQEIEIDTNDEK